MQDCIGNNMSEESLYAGPLLVGKKREIVHVLQRLQIGKDVGGVAQIFVEVVEVGKQQLAPRVEMIESLVGLQQITIYVIEFERQQDVVGHL